MHAILIVIVAIGTIFLSSVLGAILGAFAGWLVGLTPFGDMAVHALGRQVTMAEIGALCGFVGPFFKSPVSKS